MRRRVERAGPRLLRPLGAVAAVPGVAIDHGPSRRPALTAPSSCRPRARARRRSSSLPGATSIVALLKRPRGGAAPSSCRTRRRLRAPGRRVDDRDRADRAVGVRGWSAPTAPTASSAARSRGLHSPRPLGRQRLLRARSERPAHRHRVHAVAGRLSLVVSATRSSGGRHLRAGRRDLERPALRAGARPGSTSTSRRARAR